MDSEDPSVLQMIRELPPEPDPTPAQLMAQELARLNNNVESLLTKIGVANEIQLELLELRKREARRNSDGQGRRYPDMPPSPIRRLTR